MLSDEAVLALSSLVGAQLSSRGMVMEAAMAGTALLVAGTHNTILYSVVISYTVTQLLLLPLHNLFLAALILIMATQIQALVKVKVTTVVAYTIAETVAGDLLDLSHQMSSTLFFLMTLALVTYILDTRRYGILGLCSFRIAKFVLVRQGVQYAISTGGALIFHPFMWVSIIVIVIQLAHSLQTLDKRELELTDAITHACASHVSLLLVGIPNQVSSMEILVLLAIIYFSLLTTPPSPTRQLILSLVLYLAIINLRPLGILPPTLLLIANNSLTL